MFGTMIDYWHLTGDSSYNDATIRAMVNQASETADFMPQNQTRTEGNDDQGFWAMAAMSAAENKFPDPPTDKPQWLATVQAVFNQFVSRWDLEHCGGGLRWQIFTFNKGFDYKNSISNGCFFNIAARLARYTGNSTYGEWAAKIYEWELKTGLINDAFEVLDGLPIAHDKKECKTVVTDQWTYNAGIFLHGAAVMFDVTGSDVWKGRVDGILKNVLGRFTQNSIIYEPNCEPTRICNINGRSFKGYLIRWLAGTMRAASHTYEVIKPILRATAVAAAASCTGPPGTTCGFSWVPESAFDGSVGVGEQMNALDAVMYNFAEKATAPVTHSTGGTSKGNPAGGGGHSKDPRELAPVTMADRIGAGILTLILLLGVMGMTAFMMI